MKYSVSSRQTSEYLAKADEIRFEYRDRRAIVDFIEKYPETEIALVRPFIRPEDEMIDWDEIRDINVMSQGRFILGIVYPDELAKAKELGIKTFFRTPVRTFQELKDIQAAGVDQVILGAPLFFSMDKVRQVGVSVRSIANAAFIEGTWSPMNGCTGTFIRPEDIPAYEDYIDIIQFNAGLNEEQALIRIYKEQHRWPGELELIVKDLRFSATNRMIPPDFAQARLNCGQRCMETGHCHLCERYLTLANPDLIRRITEQN